MADLRPPLIDAIVVDANPNNVLSAIVTARVRDADSVLVRFRVADDAASELETPPVPVTNGIVVMPVLGLLADHQYTFRVVARASRASMVSEETALTTGSLPADLPRYTANGSSPTPGFVAFAAGRYGVVIDNAGRVVWYRHFPNGPGLMFTAQPSGHYYARPAATLPSDPTPWVELDALGNVTRTIGCANGLVPRFHDLIAVGDDTYWLLCDDTRELNLTAKGGAATARVTATDVQCVSADGRLLFTWSPFDYLNPAEADPRELAKADVNWTHGNSIDMSPDGSLVVSFRNLNEVVKIDAETGAVRWRLGGRHSSFTFLDEPETGFAGQHSVRMPRADEVFLLDNVGDPSQSRGERYVLDEQGMTARLADSYGSSPGVTTQIGGSVQTLPNGHTLVSFGTAGRVEEYGKDGGVVWRIERGADYIFHAERIASLYAPGVGFAR